MVQAMTNFGVTMIDYDTMSDYDSTNIFAKILRGEIPCAKLYEDAFALAFRDIAPSAPLHVLVIPKGAYSSFTDFISRATKEEVHGFFAAVAKVAAQENGEADYRLISNNGAGAGRRSTISMSICWRASRWDRCSRISLPRLTN